MKVFLAREYETKAQTYENPNDNPEVYFTGIEGFRYVLRRVRRTVFFVRFDVEVGITVQLAGFR